MPPEPATIDRASGALACIACGYDLRGLALDGVCPECGETIERSLRSRRLRFSDQAWMKRVIRGMSLFVIARWWLLRMVLAVFFMALVLMIVFALGGTSAGWFGNVMAAAVSAILALVGLITLLGMSFGLWLVFEPEPGIVDQWLWPTLGARGLSLIIGPFIIVSLVGLRRLTPLSQLIVAHGLLLILWLSALMVRRRAIALERRCAGSAASLAKKKRFHLVLPAIALGIYWYTTLRAGLGPPFPWPSAEANGNLSLVMILYWLGVTGDLAATLKVVRSEMQGDNRSPTVEGGTRRPA